MIGLLARGTVALRRAYDCEHVWKPWNAAEDTCCKCGVIVTPEGKKVLARATDRFHGRALKT